jgi:hypothetical protein
MAKLIGNAPNQVPTNADLGSMAFEDKKNYATTSSPIYQPYRNIIINGDMNIAQRGTSSSGITSSGYYTIDRMKTVINGSLGTWTQSQSTDVPTGQGFRSSLKMDCTTADASPSAGDYLLVGQSFEGQMLQYLKKGTSSAESLTCSFWVKSNKTGTYTCVFREFNNNRGISKSYTINSANTWEKKIITFEGDTSGVLSNNNLQSLQLQFWLGAGSSFSSGTLATSWESRVDANVAVGQVNLADNTANEWYITGVQLEAGTTASDFEFLPYDVNLNRCQRYFELTQPNYFIVSRYNTSLSYGLLTEYKTAKRTTPSIARQDGASTVDAHGAGQVGYTTVAFSPTGINVNGSATNVTTGATYDTSFCGLSSPLEIDAEL